MGQQQDMRLKVGPESGYRAGHESRDVRLGIERAWVRHEAKRNTGPAMGILLKL